jgi:nitrogen regulatory protein P-II 1
VKNIVAIVRPERLHAVKEALFRVGVTGMTLTRASGHGGEREIV